MPFQCSEDRLGASRLPTLLSVVMLTLLVVPLGCEGPTGPEGPGGARGVQGPRGPAGAANVNAEVVTLSAENFQSQETNSGTVIFQSFDHSALTPPIVNEGVVLAYLEYQEPEMWETLPINDGFFFEDTTTVEINIRFRYAVDEFVFVVQSFGPLSNAEVNEQAIWFGGNRLKIVTIPPDEAAASSIEQNMRHDEVIQRLGLRSGLARHVEAVRGTFRRCEAPGLDT